MQKDEVLELEAVVAGVTGGRRSERAHREGVGVVLEVRKDHILAWVGAACNERARGSTSEFVGLAVSSAIPSFFNPEDYTQFPGGNISGPLLALPTNDSSLHH